MEENGLNQNNQVGSVPNTAPVNNTVPATSVSAPQAPVNPAPPVASPIEQVPAAPTVQPAAQPAAPVATPAQAPVYQNNMVPNQPMGQYQDPAPNMIPGQPYPQYQVPNQPMMQYQTQNQNNNTNLGGAKAPSKKGPLLIFGFVLIVSIVLVVTLMLENGGDTNEGEITKSLITDTTKTIVVYFSQDGENYKNDLDISNRVVLEKGNTEVLSEKIASFIDADIYEIEPKVPYPTDLDELYNVSKKEKNQDTYPEIKDPINNLNDYDVVFIGYPIWHASYPQIVKTFLRDNKTVLRHKIIVAFNTHAVGGNYGTFKTLFKEIGVSGDHAIEGLIMKGTEVNTSDDTIKEWLKGIGYKIK